MLTGPPSGQKDVEVAVGLVNAPEVLYHSANFHPELIWPALTVNV